MKSKFPDENSDGVVFSRFSVVDHILYFKHLWRDHWAAVSSGAGTDLNIVAAAGAVVKAHQCVLLPLSPMLSQLLQPALSCESPWNVPTVILPDRSAGDVTRLLQLIYTGSCVITNGDMYLGLVRIMHDVGLYIPGERLSFKPVTRTLTFSAQQEAPSEAVSKHALKSSSLEERIDEETSFPRGLPPEGLNSPVSNCPGVDKLSDFDGGNDAIDLSKKAEECEVQSLVSDQFENQNDEIRTTNESKCNKEMVECDPAPLGNCTCAHCGLKFRTNTPVMYVLMHERSCKQQLLQSSEDLTMSGDPQTNVRDEDFAMSGDPQTNVRDEQPDRLPSRHSDSTESTDSNENIFSEGIFHNENNVLESSNNIANGDVEMENNDVNCRYGGKDLSKIEIKDGNENTSLYYNTPKNENMIEVVEIEDTNENNLCMAQNVPESGDNIEYIATDNDSDVNLITEIINLEQNTPKVTDIKSVEKEESGKALKTSYNCYICDEELEQLNASVYHHYATVHFSEELLRDFGERVDDDKCLDCGTVVNGLKDQYWFLVHMGVKHRRVEKYLPPQFHLGPSEKWHPTSEENVVIAEKSFVLVPEDENDAINENWAQNTSCPVCAFSMERFKVGDKSDHLYGHFKDKIKDWFAGMRYVYAFPSTTCPQCKKVFEDEHCLYKHLGSAHNLYQTFIQRSKIELEKNEESTVLNDAEMEVEKKEEIGCKTESDNVSKNRSTPKVSAKTFFPETKEANNGSKYVNRKLSLNAVNKECCLCSKQFSNYHRLRYHYSLVHFRKELEAEMYPLFENNNGSCPIKSCPKVFKRFKFFMYHMGSIHRQVDKYVETATTEDAKNPEGSKKNQPYCQAKYINCPKCDKRSRSYNCVKHMVTHYYNEIETQLKPNEGTCVECGESYENLDDLIYHAAESHKALNQFCSQEELKFIEADKDMEMPPNFCKTEKEMVTIKFKKTHNIVEKKKTPGDPKVPKTSKIMDVYRKQMKTRSNPSKCRICKKQAKNNGTLLQHLCGHFRQELKQEFSNVLCRPELEVTCPKCDIDIPKTSFITHIGAMHKEVVKYAPWLQSKKDQTSLKYKHEKVGKVENHESHSSRKRLVFLEERDQDTEAQNRNIPIQETAKNSEGNRNQESLNGDDDNTEPPLITVNPSKANVSAVWIDSDIEVLEPPAESSTSSMMALSSSSSGLSSSATTSLIPVSPLLGPGDYYGTIELAKKAFRDKNKK